MAQRKAGSALPQLLQELREKPDGTFGVGEVADIIERSMAALKVDPAVSRRKLCTELNDLSRLIRATKDEIALLSPDDVKHEYLPKAADELDAIVAATADTTNAIKTKKKTDKKVLTDEDLLEGPQKVGEAHAQEDFDTLFASFG